MITECEVCSPQEVHAADVDGDGDTDILSASEGDAKIAWHENDGTDDPSFTIHTITTNADRPRDIHAADIDGDGDTDVLSSYNEVVSDFYGYSFQSKVVLYKNDGTTDPSFTKQVIASSFGSSRDISVFAADVDGDDDTDILSASEGDAKIAWHENDGSGNFTERVITTDADTDTGGFGVLSIYAADVNGDGNTDIPNLSGFPDRKRVP